MTEKERRAHARKRVSTSVMFRDAAGTSYRGWLHNISRTGIFVACPRQLDVGEMLEFDMRIPGMFHPLSGKARVIWVREKSERDLPAGMGVVLVDLTDAQITAIEMLKGSSSNLSRPKTIVGIAPPPAASNPSFSPDVPEEWDVKKEEPPPRASEAPDAPDAPDVDTLLEGVPAVEPVDKLAETQEGPQAEPTAELSLSNAEVIEVTPPPPPKDPTPFPPLPSARKKTPRWIGLAAWLAMLGAALGAVILSVTLRGGPETAADAALDAAQAEAAEQEEEDAYVAAAPPAEDVASVPEEHDATVHHEEAHDAGHDAGKDAGRDAGKDAGHKDAGKDAGKKPAVKDAGKPKPKK